MRIKERQYWSPVPAKVRTAFGRTSPFTKALLILAALFLLAIFFFGTLGYGAYLNKIDKSTYHKNILLSIANLDFSFVKNYLSGYNSGVNEFDLDVKFEHLLRMEYLRRQALEKGIIDDELKEEEFPAKLTFEGKTYNVDINLTGMIIEHLIDPSKWSFQVKVKGDDTILGMKRFSVLIPKSRGYLTDWIGFELLKEKGLIAYRMDFIDLSINGKNHGIYYLEERLDKYMIEHNRLREGLIFNLENDISIYREEKLWLDPDQKQQVLSLRRRWQDVSAGITPLDQFFDLKKLAQLAAVCDLMGNKHPLFRRNIRFYFNPVTSLAEPIAREWEFLEYEKETSLLLEQPEISDNQHYLLEQDPLLRQIKGNVDFQRFYLEEIAELAETEFLDDFLLRHAEKLSVILKKVYLNWPFYDLPTHKLFLNQNFIYRKLHPEHTEISAYYTEADNGRLSVKLHNGHSLPITVSHISWRDSFLILPEQPILLKPEGYESADALDLYRFVAPPELLWADSLIPELKVHYHLLGLPEFIRYTHLYPWSYEINLEHLSNPVLRQANYQEFEFIAWIEDTPVLRVPAGKWSLEKDLIIPADMRLEVQAGAELDLRRGARIISYSPVFFNGSEDFPILLHSSDSTGQGMTIIRAQEQSELHHTTFADLSRPVDQGWQLSGALTFYESPVAIESCTFSGNLVGDDFLNIIRSAFLIQRSLFRDILADAFDCDFCQGSVTNTSFVRIGNDGIDVSGSKLEISHVFMNHIGDKGLSAGENSEMSARWVDIRNAEIGVTSKDRSTIDLRDARLEKARIGIAAFQKKSEFGPGTVNALGVAIESAEVPFLVEEHSFVSLDGQRVESNGEHVKDLLYGVIYGKSSN